MFSPHDELLLAVNEVTKLLGDFDAELLTGPQTSEFLPCLTRMVSAGQSAVSSCGLRIESANTFKADGHRDAASQIAAVTGVSRTDALRDLTTAKRLVELPAAHKAFRCGELSATQASLIAGGAENAQQERELLKLAQSDSVSVLKERARRMQSGHSADAEIAEDVRRRGLRTSRISTTRPDGMVSFWALMLPEEGTELKSALDRRRDATFRRKHSAGKRDSFDTNMADAFMELVRDANEHESGKCRGTKRRKRNVDATLVVDYAALKRGHRESGETVEVAGCGQVSVATAKRLLDDATFRLLVTEGVDVKTVTSKSRYWHSPVRAALEYRDQRCCVPGCDQTIRLQKDHQQWFSKGGETRLENGRNVCAHHHRLMTTKGFRLVGEPGNWRWLVPGQMDVGGGAGP